MKHVTPLVILLLTFGCNSRVNKQDNPLFYNMALQDSLMLYISQVDVIMNPYHAPTIMDISIRLEEDIANAQLDTFVTINAVYEILQAPIIIDTTTGQSFEIKQDLLGACLMNERVCVVKKMGSIEVSRIVNKDVLNIPRKDYDFFSQYKGPIYDVSISRSSREYRLDGKNRVVLVGKTIGKFEQ